MTYKVVKGFNCFMDKFLINLDSKTIIVAYWIKYLLHETLICLISVQCVRACSVYEVVLI